MKLKKWLSALCAAFLCAAFLVSGAAEAKSLQKVSSAWMGANEAFPIWYAKDQGWDKEMGLDLSLLYFSSGMDSMSTLPAGTWSFAGVGAIPAVMGALRYNSSVIAVCNDEANANAILVRSGSEIARTKGFRKDRPQILGSPASVKGKTIFLTTVSSAHYTLSTWLHTLGLTEADVKLMNMEQASALAAFQYGLGDAVALWAPLSYMGPSLGWEVVATPNASGFALPLVIVANTKYAEQNPEVTAKFLSLYMRGLNHLKTTPKEKLLPEYLRFYLEWAGTQYTKELAERDLDAHTLFSYDEQLKMFDASNGPSQMQQWLTGIASFFAESGRISRSELSKVHGADYATDKYLKLVKEKHYPVK